MLLSVVWLIWTCPNGPPKWQRFGSERKNCVLCPLQRLVPTTDLQWLCAYVSGCVPFAIYIIALNYGKWLIFIIEWRENWWFVKGFCLFVQSTQWDNLGLPVNPKAFPVMTARGDCFPVSDVKQSLQCFMLRWLFCDNVLRGQKHIYSLVVCGLALCLREVLRVLYVKSTCHVFIGYCKVCPS